MEEEKQRQKEWFYKFIRLFREEYSKLSKEEKMCLDTSNNYLTPCQVEVFWLENPELQFIVTSNMPSRKDLEIIINGPFRGHEFIEKSLSIIKKRWNAPITETDRKEGVVGPYDNYAEAMATQIHNFVEYVKFHFFNPTSKYVTHGGGGALSQKIWCQNYVGNIFDNDYHAEVDHAIMLIKKYATLKLKQKNSGSQQVATEQWSGFGAHLFPPIVVGKKSKPTVEQLLMGNDYDQSLNCIVIDTTIGKHNILIQKDGYVLVITKDKHIALRILNLIISLAILQNQSFFVVREHELSLAGYNKKSQSIDRMQWRSQTIRSALMGRSGKNFHIGYPTTEIQKRVLLSWIKNASKVIDCQNVVEELWLYAEAHTHLENTEYEQSFIMSWTIIEKYYSQKWKKKLHELGLSKKRIDKLTNSNQWSIDYIIEVMNLSKQLENVDYDLLMRLKRKRNRFYHDGEHVSKEESVACYDFATKVMREKLHSIVV
ncbi:MAG: hypothetical protein GWN01_10265 [Nitrosopumilaceae archaeon]|nr:hypothetical protein [Nitrosopumilaceae archaeon]NIU01285.1 hypothetical protein [Nitrosopumilaceae archaeon]NIU87633.1 hypothetical protein [Nitrosopumilaceae archaeon]NIV66058.1 hypothetical protein [Nitrosopumilaceae archaeon]NIX61887.1 hypothetical protein [Nitrosopumilaceae archaeon]